MCNESGVPDGRENVTEIVAVCPSILFAHMFLSYTEGRKERALLWRVTRSRDVRPFKFHIQIQIGSLAFQSYKHDDVVYTERVPEV